MRALNRLFWVILFSLIILIVGLHICVCTPSGRSMVEKQISSQTGYKVSIGDARLWGMRLSLSDVRIGYVELDGSERVILRVPEMQVTRMGGNWKVTLMRPLVTAYQSAAGNWTPEAFRALGTETSLEEACITLMRSFHGWFEVSQGRVQLKTVRMRTLGSYAGVNARRLPIYMEGQSQMVMNQVELSVVNGEQVNFSQTWFDGGIITSPITMGGGRVTRPQEVITCVVAKDAEPQAIEAAVDEVVEAEVEAPEANAEAVLEATEGADVE